MNDVPDTELFSAYLDGELTADEQVRVEQVLAASPQARQLLEELRALGSTLQGLPQEKLDEDLSSRVLEVAERRMLMPDDPGSKPSTGRAAEALKEPPVDSIGRLGQIQQGKPVWREISWRGMFSRRALIWSGVVVATAIIISLNSPPPPKVHRDLARLDKQPAAGTVVLSAEARRKPSTAEESWDVPAGQRRILRGDGLLAKDAARKGLDAEVAELRAKTDRVRREEAERLTEKAEAADAGRRADDNKFADTPTYKVPESSRRMSKTAPEGLARDLAEERAKAGIAGENRLHADEKPSQAVALSAAGGMPLAHRQAGFWPRDRKARLGVHGCATRRHEER